MFEWIRENIWVCTAITCLVGILTFVLNFIIKKRREPNNMDMKIGDVKNSTVNQAGRNIIIGKNENRE